MAAISNYLENALLNHVLRGDTASTGLAQPVSVHLALFTTDPTDAGTGAEVSGGSYARKVVSFTAPNAGVASSGAQVDYLNMPACTVTHVGVYDASTAGNLLFHGALTASKTVNAGDTFTVNAGDLSLTLD